MVQRIDRLYEQTLTQQREQDEVIRAKAEEAQAEERADGRVRRENIAERIAPHLHDQVEISEEGLNVSRSEEAAQPPDESAVSEADMQVVSQNWYAGGYQAAMESVEGLPTA